MSLSAEAIAKIATEAALAAVAASSGESSPEPQNAAKATASKAATIRRNLDPIAVQAGEVTFTVLAHATSGSLYSRGARVVGSIDGKASRSLDLVMVRALQGDGVLSKIESAIATVNKRALLADHAPKREEATTA